VTAPDDTSPRYYRITDYLAALGVPLDRVRAVHFHGGRGRIASVEGAELRREPARFVFDFVRATEGSPALGWSTAGLTNEKRIDVIYDVGVFVKQAPPVIERGCGC
jgi:hypothetical protein